MKIVVVGASGLIGSKTAENLKKMGHEVIPASRRYGVNTVTGEGLAAAFKGADTVLDVSDSPSFEEHAVMEFYSSGTRNMLETEVSEGVKHHIMLGVVGTDKLQDSAYFRAKLAQETLIKESKVPYTIVRATQFFEFLGIIAQAATVDDIVQVSTGYMQPIAAHDVANVMAETCLAEPLNGIVEISGPERVQQNEIIARYLRAIDDKRLVQGSADALYFGTKLTDESLIPGPNGRTCPMTFDQWLKTAAPVKG